MYSRFFLQWSLLVTYTKERCEVMFSLSTRYGLDVSMFEPRPRQEIFLFSTPVQTSPGAPSSLMYNGYSVSSSESKAAGAWR
jgi:hypothetical protein